MALRWIAVCLDYMDIPGHWWNWEWGTGQEETQAKGPACVALRDRQSLQGQVLSNDGGFAGYLKLGRQPADQTSFFFCDPLFVERN
jgi:hypothetical protein